MRVKNSCPSPKFIRLQLQQLRNRDVTLLTDVTQDQDEAFYSKMKFWRMTAVGKSRIFGMVIGLSC
jgi:hypothetical protein